MLQFDCMGNRSRNGAVNVDEIKQLAYEIYVLEQSNKTHHGDFHISPEDHYKQHAELCDILGIFKQAKGLFWKAFIGLVIVGAIAMAALGAILSFPKH